MAEAKKRVGVLATLKMFFEHKPGQTLKEFAAEVRELSKDEQIELARLAAAELGTELEISAAA